MMKKIFTLITLLFLSFAGFSQLSGYVTEGFESTTFPPAGWTSQSVAGAKLWARSTAVVQEGTASAFIGYETTGGQDWLIAPRFTVAVGDSIIFYMRLAYVGYAPDSLAIKVSTAGNAVTDFTTTLLKLEEGVNYPPNATSWNRYAISLQGYIGQNIYLAFKHANTDGDGLYIDNVQIGTKPAAEVQTLSINTPAVASTAAIVPTATFKNNGGAAQTFNVTFNTTGYTSTKTVTALAAGASQVVSFDSWTPASAGIYLLTAYSSLAGDINTANDTLRKDINIITAAPSNGWLSEVPLSSARWAHASTSYRSGPVGNDTAYLVLLSGGDGTFANTTTVSRFNTTSKEWVSLAPVPVSRTQLQAFTANGKIFLIGGYAGSFAPVNRTDIYDIATNTWSVGANMPQASGDYAGAQYNDSLIYIIGGYSGSTDLTSVQIYNTNTNTWSAGTAFTGTAVAGARAGISRGKIIMTGGYNQVLAAELSQAYRGTIDPVNPANITWTALPAYPGGTVGRHAAAGLSASKYVYFTAGDPTGAGTVVLNSTYAYNVVDDVWESLPNKTSGMSNIETLSPIVRNDTLYLASTGGYDGTVVTSVNEWLNLGSAAVVLPIKLVDFTATLMNKKTQLKWQVVEDGKGGQYTIQRSSNALNFEDMQRVNAGYLARTITYNAQDLIPYNGFTYYRIKIVDIDGQVTYSPVRSVRIDNVAAIAVVVSVAPNPSQGMIKLNMQSNATGKTAVAVRITDASGKIVATEKISLDRVSFSSYNLRPGMYFVQVSTDDKRLNVTEKVIVL